MHTGHEYYRELLPDYANDRLSAELEDELRTHVSGCSSCRSDAEVLRAGIVMLRGQETPRVPDYYFATVLPRVRERLEKRSSRAWLGMPLVSRFAAPLVALVLAAVLIGRVSLSPRSQESTLRSMIGSLDMDEIADVLVTQSQLTPWSEILLSDVVPETAVAGKLAADILENGEVNTYQTVSDLSDHDVDILLQRLGERKIL